MNEVLFQAKRFRIERVEQRTDDGTTHYKEIVRHPGAVAILPLLDDGRICFVENFRAAVGQRMIELPAGTLEPPEDPLATARRELLEETGYRAKTIEHLTTFAMSPGIMDEKMYFYAAKGLTPGPMALEAGEDIKVLLLNWDDALEMVRDGRIYDAKTVAGLLYYATFRSENKAR